MKLSDVKGERTLEVIADILEPIANIAEDEAAANLFRREKVPEGMSVKSFLLARVKKCVPALLRGHKADVIAILASIEGVTQEEYAENLNLPKLMSDLTDLLVDDMFKAFFTSPQSGKSSGSAQENTEAPKT